MLQLLNKLLMKTARYHAGLLSFELPLAESECQNQIPHLRIAASIPPILTLSQQECLHHIISMNAALHQDVELLTVPFTQGEEVPDKHQRASLLSQSRILLGYCRHIKRLVHQSLMHITRVLPCSCEICSHPGQ